MNVPGVAWVALIIILIPVIQTWIAMQWPEVSYPIAGLIVGVLAGVAKWLQMYFTQPVQPPQPPAGVMGAAASQSTQQSSKVRIWLIG